MADGEFEPDFLLEWTGQISPVEIETVGSGKTPASNRLAKESKERREKRLRQARECSARRRSMETPDQRELRLKAQRDRMQQKRQAETDDKRELRYVCMLCMYVC